MVESIVKLCELLIQLLQHGHAARKSSFESHLDPIFRYMVSIHQDYVTAFDEISALLLDPYVPVADILSKVRQRQSSLAHVRQLVGDLAKAFEASATGGLNRKHRGQYLYVSEIPKDWESCVACFTGEVIHYLQHSCGHDPRYYLGSRYAGLIGLCEFMQDGHIDREGVTDMAVRTKEKLPIDWAQVSRLYAELKVASLR